MNGDEKPSKNEEIKQLKSEAHRAERASAVRSVGQGHVFIERMKLDLKIATEINSLRKENVSLKADNLSLKQRILELERKLELN